MADGRLLVPNGQSFLIIEPDEAARIDRWTIFSIAVDIVCIVAVLTTVLLQGQGRISDDGFFTVIWTATGIFILSAMAIGVPVLIAMLKRIQPADEHDRLKELWDQLG